MNPSDDYRNARLPAGTRAELLLRQMTLEEKCHQLTSVLAWSLIQPDGTDTGEAEEILRRAPGHIASVVLDDPVQLADMIALIQKLVMTRTRLGIPVLFHGEGVSGFQTGGYTPFPTGTGLAATWSPDLVEEMADIIRLQMRRSGILHALSPVMDVALDPRWGRVHETYGEDPYLCAALSVAYTRGLQGSDISTGVIATAKHFLGYSLPQGGLNRAAFDSGQRRTRDLFAYPVEAAIQLAGLRSVMNSYSEVDSIPAAASREVLTDLLRETLGFDGFVSADYNSIENLVVRQRVAADGAEAGRMALRAGIDVEFPKPYGYGDALVAEVQRGAVDIKAVDLSVWRVLRAKFEVGLFENPYPAERIEVAAAARQGRELSEELARRSVVLLKNDGILPIARDQNVRIAVIGPHSDAAALQFPAYSYPAFRQLMDAMARGELGTDLGDADVLGGWYRALVPVADSEELVRSMYGATTLAEEIARSAGAVTVARGSTITRDLGQEAIDQAVMAAHASDVVVLALGGASLWFSGERTEGEGSDAADISLPAAQARLAEAVAAVGKPVIVVLVQGRGYALPQAVTDAAAIVACSYAGPSGSRAITEVLFGDTNPSGKLPYSIPRHNGQIPVYHHQKAGSGYRDPLAHGRQNHYADMPATPLYPFGHGLSYTTFALSDLVFDQTTSVDGTTSIAATVTNTGDRVGAAVVQLYVRVNTPVVTRPAQQLAGFARLEVPVGSPRRVTFSLNSAQLGYTNAARQFAVEAARVDLFIGLDSDDRQLEGSFEVQGPPRVLASSQRSFLADVAVDLLQ